MVMVEATPAQPLQAVPPAARMPDFQVVGAAPNEEIAVSAAHCRGDCMPSYEPGPLKLDVSYRADRPLEQASAVLQVLRREMRTCMASRAATGRFDFTIDVVAHVDSSGATQQLSTQVRGEVAAEVRACIEQVMRSGNDGRTNDGDTTLQVLIRMRDLKH